MYHLSAERIQRVANVVAHDFPLSEKFLARRGINDHLAIMMELLDTHSDQSIRDSAWNKIISALETAVMSEDSCARLQQRIFNCFKPRAELSSVREGVEAFTGILENGEEKNCRMLVGCIGLAEVKTLSAVFERIRNEYFQYGERQEKLSLALSVLDIFGHITNPFLRENCPDVQAAVDVLVQISKQISDYPAVQQFADAAERLLEEHDWFAAKPSFE